MNGGEEEIEPIQSRPLADEARVVVGVGDRIGPDVVTMERVL